MTHPKMLVLAAALASFALLSASHAADNPSVDKEILRIAESWAHIKYEVKDKDVQYRDVSALAKDAAEIVQRYPDRAEPLVWEGIVTSEEAAMANPFSALGYAKAARVLFEKAGMIDQNVLKGAVPMSLGTLYYRVPGFPIAFGDDAKARRYLEQALSMDPNGLDANYFYGDFLMEQGEYDNAKRVLTRGLSAPTNAERPIWDAGRRQEIRELLAKLDARTAAAH